MKVGPRLLPAPSLSHGTSEQFAISFLCSLNWLNNSFVLEIRWISTCSVKLKCLLDWEKANLVGSTYKMPLATICKLAGISLLPLHHTVRSSIENVMGLYRHQRVFTLNNSFRGQNSFMQLDILSL